MQRSQKTSGSAPTQPTRQSCDRGRKRPTRRYLQPFAYENEHQYFSLSLSISAILDLVVRAVSL